MSQQVLSIYGSMDFIGERDGSNDYQASRCWLDGFHATASRGWLSLGNVERGGAHSGEKAYIDAHLENILQSTAVFIANYPKNSPDGYIGANTLMEAAMAYTLGVPVYFLFPMFLPLFVSPYKTYQAVARLSNQVGNQNSNRLTSLWVSKDVCLRNYSP